MKGALGRRAFQPDIRPFTFNLSPRFSDLLAKSILGRSGYRYFVTTESCSSVRLEHHTDNVGVGSSNLPGTTIMSPKE